MACACVFLLLVLGPQLLRAERIHSHSLLGLSDEASNAARTEALTKEGAGTTANLSWSLFGDAGPKMEDIEQGALGDCYYLAGLAAIARVHPNLIEDVFVSRDTVSKSGLKVFQLRFYVNGVENVVALDEMVPCRKGDFHFACARDAKSAWPVLMEKGFAKIFGSYLAIASGWGYVTFKAITQAPVDIYDPEYPDGGDEHEWDNPDGLWDVLSEALQENFPITAGSVENDFGLAKGHAFAVMGLGSHPEHGRTIQVYNPWASNKYDGELSEQNDWSKGDYFLTFDEFMEAFDSIEVARIRKGYNVYYKRLPVGKPVALSFTVHGSDPFHVQLEWPTERFFKVYGCPFELDHAKLMVKRVDDGQSWRASKAPSTTSLRVDLEGPGDYLVYAFSSFHGAPWVEEMAVNVYANEPVEFEELDSALTVGREILGFPCKALEDPGWISDYYLALPYPVGGSPAWQLKSLFGSTKVIWMNKKGELTLAPSENRLNKFFPKFNPSKLKCTRKDVKGGKKEKEKLTAPEPDTEEEVNTNCDFAVGERVSYNLSGTWVCSEVEEVYKDSVEVRFHFEGDDTLGCHSRKLMKVPQCEFHEEDRVRYNDPVKGWVDEQIASVECGTVTLSSGRVVGCDEDHLEYPVGCVFHKDEQVLIWSMTLQRWTVATVVDVDDDEKVRVRYSGEESGTWRNKVIDCDSHLLKKLSRCDRRSLNQMTRFKDLNNFDELVDGLEDSLFRPKLESIGPPGADCGDAARGGDPDPCEQYNSWGPISKMLK